MVLGITICGAGWSLLAIAPVNHWGIAAFALMLMCFSVGAVLIFINFLALRQAVTPEPMLGRMTSTMRWLILLPAGPGALIGGWMGEHAGLHYSLAFAGVTALLLAAFAWRNPIIRGISVLPTLSPQEERQSLMFSRVDDAALGGHIFRSTVRIRLRRKEKSVIMRDRC
jgi:hypothetical protein